MKRCTYCGKEYSDDSVVCALDEQPLTPVLVIGQSAADTPARQGDTDLAYPDYQWKAKDGWKLIAIVVSAGIVIGAFQTLLVFCFHGRINFKIEWLVQTLVYHAVCVLAAACFARTDTWPNFVKGFGLDRRPSYFLPYGLAAVILLRFADAFLHVRGYRSRWFDYNSGVSSYDILYRLLPICVFAPLFEEIAYRGFLYKAFRGSYSIAISTLLVLGLMAFTHLNQYTHSLLTGFELTAFFIVLCWLREKSESLWDCIICHFVFNASMFLVVFNPSITAQ